MADAAGQGAELSTPKAPKDKKCPYCGQAFTSSSLGRHLDLYIKEKNPKPPDGIHDVEAIRKLRGSITRRQPRGSLARRDTSTPAGTPTAGSKKSPTSDGSTFRSPVAGKDAHEEKESIGSRFSFPARWEVSGAVNDVPLKNGEVPNDGEGALQEPDRPAGPSQRAVSRQMMKAQLDMKQKVQDAVDTARAAELALRELLSSLRAAKCVSDLSLKQLWRA
jgi:hypothetical protein